MSNVDILKYDTSTSRIYLSESGIKKLSQLKVSLGGRAFILKIDDEKVLGGWFWNIYSSNVCDRLWTLTEPEKDNYLYLKFGIRGFKCGKDLRLELE